MNEYEFCTRILSPRLCPKNQNRLEEKKLAKAKIHSAAIVKDAVDAWTLYRYDQDEDPEHFFPFFNNSRGENGAPVDLLKFCDYIVLVSKNRKMFVLLVEMKSGKTGDAGKQLEASYTFMQYVLRTAERIASANDYRDVDFSNVRIRKIVLKPQQKSGTNIAKSLDNRIDWDGDIVTLPSLTLPLSRFCK